MKPLLEATQLTKHYPIKRFLKPLAHVKALDGVSFKLESKKTLAIVGESGCGKSTLAKLLIQIETPTSGSVQVNGRELATLPPRERVKLVQMIFQDPYSSINPRKRAWEIIAEPLRINSSLSKAECRDQAIDTMKKVGLRAEFANRYPHMFSGGQRQRIGIARALILRPKVMVCDEPVSALDVSIQAQVINLLIELQDSFDLSYVFISHDLSVVRHLADDVLIMYLGKVVEQGDRKTLFSNPLHPYTRALLGSAQNPVKLSGDLPSPLTPPSGCTLRMRCPLAMEICAQKTPELREISGRKVACHLALS